MILGNLYKLQVIHLTTINMNLLELVKDIDYQKRFSYEQRAFLFNEYQIPTNTKFLVPIWELAQYIVSIDSYNKKSFSCFGHGQTILNKDLGKKIADNKELRIGVDSKKTAITIRALEPNGRDIGIYGKWRNMLTFDLKRKTVRINRRIVHVGSFEIVSALNKVDLPRPERPTTAIT